MQRKNMALLAALFAVAIAIILFVSFYMYSFAYKSDAKITLPSKDNSDVIHKTEGADEYYLESIKLNSENVIDVITSMDRPDEYSNLVEISTFWGDNTSIEKYSSDTKGDLVRIQAHKANSDLDFTTIMTPKSVYTWKNGAKIYSQFATGDFSADDYLHIPTYEDISTLSSDEIEEVKLVDYNAEVCIFVSTVADENGYSQNYMVSTLNGILLSSETYKDEILVRKEIISNIKIGGVENSVFDLPNGVKLIE